MRGALQCTDDTGHAVAVPGPARRIVSLVPSHTETIARLAGEEALVGITRYCVRPVGLPKRRMVVGGTKDPNLEAIVATQPDLVVVNREENLAPHIEWLRERVPVYESATVTLDDAARTITHLGTLLGVGQAATQMVAQLAVARSALGAAPALRRWRTLYLVWRKPYRSINGTTYIHHLLDSIALDNVCASDPERYPSLEPGRIAALRPQVVLLPDEPFPFGPRHERALVEQLRPLLPRLPRFERLDGSACCWYGVRTAEGLNELLPWRRTLEGRLASEPTGG